VSGTSDEERRELEWLFEPRPEDEERVLPEGLYDARIRDAELRDYDPIHPGGLGLMGVLRKVWAGIVAIGLAAVKFGAFTIKFFGIFISVAAYALIWGWRFGVGFVLLILVHEMGHFVEAKRQGLHPGLPVFVPFLGAAVLIKDMPRNQPYRHWLISVAGPVAGGLAAVGCGLAGESMDSRLLLALAYTTFFLNLFNLLPLPFLDGGFMWNAARTLMRAGRDPYAPPELSRTRGRVLVALHVALAALLALGMWWTHVPQDRL